MAGSGVTLAAPPGDGDLILTSAALGHPRVKILGKKFATLDGVGNGHPTERLLTIGELEVRGRCRAHLPRPGTPGHPEVDAEVEVRSFEEGGRVFGANGNGPLRDEWRPIAYHSTEELGNARMWDFAIIYPDGKVRHLWIVPMRGLAYGHRLGCAFLAVATNA